MEVSMMDAIEVLTNLDQIHGYYQPIFSADAHTVMPTKFRTSPN